MVLYKKYRIFIWPGLLLGWVCTALLFGFIYLLYDFWGIHKIANGGEASEWMYETSIWNWQQNDLVY